jgi:hypothetical protein
MRSQLRVCFDFHRLAALGRLINVFALFQNLFVLARKSLFGRVVIVHSGPAERGHHAQLLQRRQHRRPLYRATVVRVQGQLISPDSLAQAGLADQRRCVFSRLFPVHLPAHNLRLNTSSTM